MRRRRYKSADFALSTEEVLKVERSFRTKKEEVIVRLAMDAGLRRGEVMHFRGHWFDPESAAVRVPAGQECACHRCRGDRGPSRKPGLWVPKTSAGARVAPILSDQLLQLLPHWDFMGWRFRQAQDQQVVWRAVKGVLIRAGLDRPLPVHCLRATYAMRVARLGVGPGTLMAVLGWDDVDVAYHYIRRAEAAEALQDVRAASELRSLVGRCHEATFSSRFPPNSPRAPARDPAFA